jgi:large repetitive protein
MKEILLTLFTFSFCIIISAQKVDYDNSSKLFMGVNLGGTWNTTDVKYKLGAGWGLTLGKSYNYNYSKIVSFDVRGRYLAGNWYGQDTSSSSLADYSGTALSAYQPQGGIIHNFKSKTRRLALELAVHLNGLTEKTGIDPYVFGGIGLTFNRTYGNLLQIDSSSIYQYPTALSELDDTYESVLDDYDAKIYKVNAMPSFGFGLGYQIGKATTIGIEHKTTFTQQDVFDGVSNSSPRSKNDLYHYTSLYIQFRVNKTLRENPLPNQTVSCPKPIIKFSNSYRDNSVSTSPQFTINASVTNVAGMSNISLLNSSNIMVPYSYNSYSNQLSANVILNPGINIFTLTATNECGTEQKTITIQYKDCIDPSLSFINPSSERTIVRVPSFTFSASINGFQNTQGVLVYHNGALLNNISFNPSTLVLQGSVILQPGLNEFIVTLTNNCGSISSNTSVTYENCARPTITSTNPQNNALVTLSALTFKARIENITSKENIIAKLNGNIVSTIYNLNTKIVDLRLQLTPGLNTISLTATNNCGTTNETIIINYDGCKAPIISIIGRDNTFSVAPYTLSANISNMASQEGITVTQNGAPQNFTFSNGQLSSNINLQAGENKLIVSAVKSCGRDSKTIIINFNDCIAPAITINGRNSTVSAAVYSLSARIVNMPSREGITVTLNGSPQNFTFSNGQLTSTINLQAGENKLIISAVRNCGTDSKTIAIIYTIPRPNPKPPVEEKKDPKSKPPKGKEKEGG